MLMNYIELVRDVPVRMHLSDRYDITREVHDKLLNRVKSVNSLTFWVDELDGQPASRSFSVLSDRLRGKLEPYLAGNRFREFDLVITKRGEGFAVDWSVEAVPRNQTA